MPLSLCECRSMKPGATISPLQSMIRGEPATSNLPTRDDPVALDRDVADDRFGAAAVVDRAAAEDEIGRDGIGGEEGKGE